MVANVVSGFTHGGGYTDEIKGQGSEADREGSAAGRSPRTVYAAGTLLKDHPLRRAKETTGRKKIDPGANF